MPERSNCVRTKKLQGQNPGAFIKKSVREKRQFY